MFREASHKKIRRALIILGACLLASGAHAEDARRHKLEAAFLYNFFNYVTWPGYSTPDELTSPTICVRDGDPISTYLAYVQRKMATQRKLTIRNWKEGDDTKGCNILFLRSTMHTAVATSVLTVSDQNEFIGEGGMIAMRPQEDRIALRINNSLLSARGFSTSSRLLSLAQEVK